VARYQQRLAWIKGSREEGGGFSWEDVLVEEKENARNCKAPGVKILERL
jgi:hypothetical protein